MFRTVARPRLAGLIAVMTFAALFAAGCNTDAKDPSAVSGPSLSASKAAKVGAPSTTRAGFAVLANAAVTCTDGTITGDVGTFHATPPGAITLTTCPITGTTHVGDTAAIQAYNAFLTTYAALAPKAGDVCTTLSGTLSGVTLAPGTYCFPAAATLTGTLTLNGPANGTWIFKIGTLGTGALTGTSFSVVMAGGGQSCNVTWWVSQAATMTDSHFMGSILAGAAMTLTRGSFDGNAYAGAAGVGDVTITGTAVTGCGSATLPPPPPPPCKKSFGDRVTGGGWIFGPSGAKANFAVAGGIMNGKFWGHLTYDAHGLKGKWNDLDVKGTGVTAYAVVDAVTRHIEGTARINGHSGFTYKVDVSDNGEPGRNDTFSLWLSNGYTASGKVMGGNIQLHKAHVGACKEHDGHEEHHEHDDGDDNDAW